ncbi:beta-ketoacyl-ACP synthase [Brasilonema bromeliae]|uniref:Beta-ketoacyl-ACP synthase n=1 Tax=Brasilonema bromeliae SPC951 TaxID=385972 RepID=A0ABX1P3B7_9CYAN|nr:beta-ketoacyl-ACP synthase [Brasilonema bromeliae]NMG18578.1 beta-ketoacyl-ACP synthase [Brasilonema bromeliae SPC951]
MVAVVVTGIGLVSALGKNLEDSWQKLIAGESGIRYHQPFPELEPRPLGMIWEQPAQMRMLTQLVVTSALKDAGLCSPLPDCGVVIGSSRSYQGLWEQMARQMHTRVGELLSRGAGRKGEEELISIGSSSPQHPAKSPVSSSYLTPSLSPSSKMGWLDTLPHMNAIAAARQIGACGVVLAPMAACATGIWAIAQAAYLIQTGQCQRVIAGAVETPITPLTIAGFQQMGALAKTGANPFDIRREGLVLGEGGAVFVLESAELAQQRQAKVYGQILGFGLTADAYHANVPEPEARSAIAAVKQCLNRSHLSANDIDYIHAHGTATQLNDSLESFLIQKLFFQGVAVSSTKGATGHTLGASGALGVAFSLMALEQQFLPPCVGLRHPEFDLDLVRESRQSKIQRVLCFSFGFGGQNAVIALSQYS